MSRSATGTVLCSECETGLVLVARLTYTDVRTSTRRPACKGDIISDITWPGIIRALATALQACTVHVHRLRRAIDIALPALSSHGAALAYGSTQPALPCAAHIAGCRCRSHVTGNPRRLPIISDSAHIRGTVTPPWV